MRLYATTTSERASKGQGGNEYLNIEIRNEKQELKAFIGVKATHTGMIIGFINADDTLMHKMANTKITSLERGKRQKDEKYCNICNIKHDENGNLCEYCKCIVK